MENATSFYFTKEELANSPSRRTGVDENRELSYRQQAANFIQDMGQRLQVSQLCINTAIVYMHRFYAFHSFTEVHRNNLSVCALFLAAKVEEQPRKIEHVIKVAHVCLHKDAQALDVRSEAYADRMNEVVAHENVLLQTLGFVLAIEHPHTYVVKVCQLVKASKDLAQTSYIMATTSLHMTTMCLLYKPTVVACVCIHLACKWSNYMIEPCSEGRDWFYYVDRSVTWELLEDLTQDYIGILERSPHRFKKKFGKDAAAGYHGPSSITIEEPSQNRPSTSSDSKNSSTRKDSPSTSFSGAPYDFGSEFDEKRVLKYESPPEKSSAAASGSSSQSSHKYPTPGPEAVSIKIEPDLEKVDTPVKTDPPVPKSKHPKHRINSLGHDSHNSKDKAPSVVASSQPNQKYPTPVPVQVKVEEPPVVKAASDPHKSKHPKHRINSSQHDGQGNTELVPQGNAKGPSPAKDIKTNGSKEDQTEKKVHVENDVAAIRRTPDVPSKHERREKHKSKHSSHSSKDRQLISNHSEQSTGIKVKIRKDIILNLPESPKMPLKIKLPKPPMHDAHLPPVPKVAKHDTPTSLKLVITKDKSGSGSYSTSHKNERESRKRPHGSAPDGGYKNSHEPQNKYPRPDHAKSHHADPLKQNKVSSRHSMHRDHVPSNSTSVRLQGVNDTTFHNYNAASNYQNYPYQMTPPPPPPKLRGHGMLVGKTNSNPPLPPPLPPPPPPPPE